MQLDIPAPKPYTEQLAERHAAQAGMSRQEVAEQMARDSEFAVDTEQLVEQGKSLQHHWVDRGLKLSCEGAGHPQHEVWKPRKKY